MKIILRDGTGVMQLRFLSEEPDRHGNVRVYFRRHGRRVRLRETPGTQAFLEEYRRVSAIGFIPKARSDDVNSLNFLCGQYYQSMEFRVLVAKERRRRVLDDFCCHEGEKPYRLIEPRHIEARAGDKESPHAYNDIVKALRGLFSWAKAKKLAEANPAKEISLLRGSADGFYTWTREDVLAFQKRHPIGTKARLACDLLLYTGVRRSDVVTLGRQMEREGKLHFIEAKNRKRKPKRRAIPILPVLRQSIDATPSGHMTYLVTQFGKPFGVKGFGNWFKRRCQEAGLSQCSAHGLRKAGATFAAEGGATEHELMALFGWDTPKQAALYTRKADREKLTVRAIRFLDPDSSGVSHFPAADRSGATTARKRKSKQ